jgi:hypothetical protein
MHKDFYASGFLYHSRSGQILLQQKNSASKDTEWCLIGGVNLKGETSEQTFLRIIKQLLGLNLKPTAACSIYTYFHEGLKKDHYINYAKVTKLENFPSVKDAVFAWFNFKQIHKLNVSEQTKQDIIVGQRVIDSATRKSLGERTIG